MPHPLKELLGDACGYGVEESSALGQPLGVPGLSGRSGLSPTDGSAGRAADAAP